MEHIASSVSLIPWEMPLNTHTVGITSICVLHVTNQSEASTALAVRATIQIQQPRKLHNRPQLLLLKSWTPPSSPPAIYWNGAIQGLHCSTNRGAKTKRQLVCSHVGGGEKQILLKPEQESPHTEVPGCVV